MEHLERVLRKLLRQNEEGMTSRNNRLKSYLPFVPELLRCIRDDRLSDVPAPLCVQLQVASTCSTHCRMCDHWMPDPRRGEDLSTLEWQSVFEELAGFGVTTVILSGGEPLVRADLCDLVEGAHARGLAIGLLTNGTMPHASAQKRQQITATLRRCVQWVAISVDGTEAEDHTIRRPEVEHRIDRVRELCGELKGGPHLSATVTLQKANIHMGFDEAIRFVHELGIEQVNFKLATGAIVALRNRPEYLLNDRELDHLDAEILRSPLADEPGNNLDYLRRCFAEAIFTIEDAAEGGPVRSLYRDHSIRCFTPFLFALIDSDGRVYPCCHLYRDNHGRDRASEQFRDKHCLGNVREASFREIWRGKQYVQERRDLAVINPDRGEFRPCSECTRHCQHNLALTRLQEAFAEDLDALEDLLRTKGLELRLPTTPGPVWF